MCEKPSISERLTKYRMSTFIPAAHYMYIEATYQLSGDQARLLSRPIYVTGSANMTNCTFQFWYHMYGEDIGTLNVYARSTNVPLVQNLLWSKSGDQLNQWHNAKVSFSWDHSNSFQVCTLNNYCLPFLTDS